MFSYWKSDHDYPGHNLTQELQDHQLDFPFVHCLERLNEVHRWPFLTIVGIKKFPNQADDSKCMNGPNEWGWNWNDEDK